MKANQELLELTAGRRLETDWENNKFKVDNIDLESYASDKIVFNHTFYFDSCISCLSCQLDEEIFVYPKNTQMKFTLVPKKPSEISPKYKYDFEFADAEKFAITWTNKKIDFINDMAKYWGGGIADIEAENVNAPRYSTALTDIARCENLTI